MSEKDLSLGVIWILRQPFEPNNLGSNPARSAGFNRVITVAKLLMYSASDSF